MTVMSRMQAKSAVNVVTWTPDGRRLLAATQVGEFTSWNAANFNFEGVMQVGRCRAWCCCRATCPVWCCAVAVLWLAAQHLPAGLAPVDTCCCCWSCACGTGAIRACAMCV